MVSERLAVYCTGVGGCILLDLSFKEKYDKMCLDSRSVPTAYKDIFIRGVPIGGKPINKLRKRLLN